MVGGGAALRDLRGGVRAARQIVIGRRLGPWDDVLGVVFSPERALRLVSGGYPKACLKVYEAVTGKELHSRRYNEEGQGCIHHSVIDPSGKLLVTTGHQKCAFVQDLQSGEVVHALDDSCHTQGLCFDDAGKRLAYAACHPKPVAEVVICDPSDGWRELRRFTVRDWTWIHCEF